MNTKDLKVTRLMKNGEEKVTVLHVPSGRQTSVPASEWDDERSQEVVLKRFAATIPGLKSDEAEDDVAEAPAKADEPHPEMTKMLDAANSDGSNEAMAGLPPGDYEGEAKADADVEEEKT